MLGDWKRPENVPYPSVWSRFDGKREINGKIPKFWIQDIPDNLFEEVAEFMCTNYIYEEPLCKYLHITEDILSMEEIRQAWKMVASEKLGLICFMENPDPKGKPIIAGVNVTCIKTKEEPNIEFAGEKLNIMIDSINYVYNLKDTFEIIGENEYLSAIGMSVLPEFRGQGIGDQFLLARIPLAKALGLKATFTVFTAPASQKLAERNGFKDAVCITYDDLEKANPKFKYPGIKEETNIMRLMYKIIE